MTQRSATSIYYLHPLLAGPIDGWPRHFERCARMGFRQVLLAPPFLPGRSGDIFLASDHHRLNPRLGTEDALGALAKLAQSAGEHGLGLMIDLVIDRVAAESQLAVDGGLYRRIVGEDAPPDPRTASSDAFAAVLDGTVPDQPVFDWWRDRLGEWLDAGIAGFRCDSPQHLHAELWKRLIRSAHDRNPEVSFIAWVPGASAEMVRGLAVCGFDQVTSSSWAWDLRADWLEDETRRNGAVGRLLTMPELPFGRRLAASARPAETACRRALQLAAAYGSSWLMPMGFEFGARTELDPAHGQPDDFDSLLRQPTFDLSDAVAEANELHDSLAGAGDARVISAPYAPVAAIWRAASGAASSGSLLLVNAALDLSAQQELSLLLPEIGGMTSGQNATTIDLAPGESTLIPLKASGPIQIPPASLPSMSLAVAAPRIAIEAVKPSVDNGRFAVKRIVGETLTVTADVICDGHDKLSVSVLWRPADNEAWHEIPASPLGNDVWTASFPLLRTGRYFFTVQAWVGLFATYRDGLAKKHAAGVPLDLDLIEGCQLVATLAETSTLPRLRALAQELDAASPDERRDLLLADDTAAMMAGSDTGAFLVRSDTVSIVDAERKEAGFASWYELFPRSQGASEEIHGTFDDVILRLPAIHDMGFDVLYFPPIHPIGTKNRKGRNNALRAEPGDLGSPYAIGSSDGGHDAIHPELGTIEDFRRLLVAARQHDLEIALDFAIQCSPDHPWLRDHPDWFSWRPDGSIRYAENPPKKYEDIVNVAFYAEAARPALWLALRDVVQFWVDEGIRIFRVDNPHTKPLPFWEWMIGDIRSRNPDVFFLAEAFTRPKVMYRLAKVGFSQSYTYFTWRNTAFEMQEYLTELTTAGPEGFFRPHFFVNTPDINPEFLHDSGRPGFLLRAAMAATLSGLWGVYNGYELCEADSLDGREEYRDSEKYQTRHWDMDRPGNIIAEIRQLNRIRRANPALHSHLGVTFLTCSNETMLCYVKATPDHANVLLIAVSFDPHVAQEADIELPPEAFGLSGSGALALDDLMREQTSVWNTGTRHLRLDPADLPFAIWRVRPTLKG